MARLHYHNLGVRNPERLMQNTVRGLQTFYDYLTRTRKHLESDAAVRRLAWAPGPGPETDEDDDEQQPKGYWVRLEEPKDRPNEPESTFRAFLDEGTSEVFVTSAPSQQKGSARRAEPYNFKALSSIEVLDRDPATQQLLLSREPRDAALLLRPNTYQIFRQIQALQNLQNSPDRSALPLLKLFESIDHTTWPVFEPDDFEPEQWLVLTNASRPGTSEQRRFVRTALTTPDFAFLEGPPGSGKTTAICELVLQLALQGKRVLLCASTHVAVDNVLERLMAEDNPHRDLMIPIRIGDTRNVSEKAAPWQLQRFVRTERKRLLDELQSLKARSAAQQDFYAALQHGNSTVERMVLEAANLVCGTTIGILQHPDIKNSQEHVRAEFDVLIIDEASKTTFQEFLVPALFARRWIIVGDPRQLSPYVDDTELAINLEACLTDAELRNACVDTFFAAQSYLPKQRTTVATVSNEGLAAYQIQAAARDVDLATPQDDTFDMASASLVVGELKHLEARQHELPLDVTNVRASETALPALRRQVDAWNNRNNQRTEEPPSWSTELAWRMARLYEQRFTNTDYTGKRKTTQQRLNQQINALLPAEAHNIDNEKVQTDINSVRRVALPSILESLRYGFERASPPEHITLSSFLNILDPTFEPDRRQKRRTALTDGMLPAVLESRHVLLSTQHRMHHDIATFSHEHIYDSEALHSPDYLAEKRTWSYPRYAHHALWLDVRGHFNRKNNSNTREAEVVVHELKRFEDWARQHQRDDGQPWEVAVLTFYRGQEREIRRHLRKWSGNSNAMRTFKRGPNNAPFMSVELCTIDRFQGHEADLVFISVARKGTTSFLESPNRLNVALTRARFQRVVVGHRTSMFDSNAEREGTPQRSIFAEFAANEPWDSHEVNS